jgi:hypothetical protein
MIVDWPSAHNFFIVQDAFHPAAAVTTERGTKIAIKL